MDALSDLVKSLPPVHHPCPHNLLHTPPQPLYPRLTSLPRPPPALAPYLMASFLHVARAHPKGFPCPSCPSTFTRRRDLDKHELIVHDKRRRWSCKVCMMPFSRRHHMERHMRGTHHKRRPFECTLCSSKFSRRDHLVNHKKAVHM